MILPRTLEASIIKAGSQFPVLLITGARQVGKTAPLRRARGRKKRPKLTPTVWRRLAARGLSEGGRE